MTRSSGGRAASAGIQYQCRVAAWMATRILAEQAAELPWQLDSSATLDWLRCETEQPVDDLMAGTSTGGLVFAQAKRSIDLSTKANSEFASAIGQFVRQFVACRQKTGGMQKWDRELDPIRDRLLLVTTSESSGSIRIHLPKILAKLRETEISDSLEAAANNNYERMVLNCLLEHTIRIWRELSGLEPTSLELRDFFHLLRVQILDVENGQPGYSDSLTLLRSTVLRESPSAEAAWAIIVELCVSLSASSGGTTRYDLQKELLRKGVDLRAPRGFIRDIEKIRSYSTLTHKALSPLSELKIGESHVKIARQCTAALKSAAEERSLLVVGLPGAGKSGALHDFVTQIACEHDCIMIAVDRLGAGSLGELRNELGLEHELLDVLLNWPGTQPGFVVVDALDAARGEESAAVVKELIQQIILQTDRWRVLASIRKFDLRYNDELKRLFVGSGVQGFIDDEFVRVRHLEIPLLSESELEEIAQQSGELSTLLAAAPAELKQLLRVPFNLRLSADLLDAGVQANQLTPITTQLELLDRYWRSRVFRTGYDADARENLLRIACNKMVQQRALHVPRADISHDSANICLRNLLSDQILVEWQSSPESAPDRYTLAFSHHVLFDYAVSRLYLRGQANQLLERLHNDPDLAIVIRPSLLLHFRHVWVEDSARKRFWELACKVEKAGEIRQIAKLIAPTAAAEMAKVIIDLEPLLSMLEREPLANSQAANQVLRHTIGALLSAIPGSTPLTGEGAGPWCDLLERASAKLRISIAYSLRPLLCTISEHPDKLTTEQRRSLGIAARNLYEFAWLQEQKDIRLIIHALQAIFRTYESNESASLSLIMHSVAPTRLAEYGHQIVPWVAREVERLIGVANELVETLYKTIFGYEETSEQSTSIGTSQILPMISNAKQDYQLALYELAKTYPAFLQSSPVHAIRAMLVAVESYAQSRQSTQSEPAIGELFIFRGKQACTQSDVSAIWDERDLYAHDNAFKMLDAFTKYLESLASDEANSEKLAIVLDVIGENNRCAVIWRRILRSAARYPATLGRTVVSLLKAKPILVGYDTTMLAGEYLKHVFGHLDEEDRLEIEQAILSIDSSSDTKVKTGVRYTRNRLLGCIPTSHIVSPDALKILEQLQTEAAIPPNNPPFSFSEWSGSVDDNEYLRRVGVNLDEAANNQLLLLTRPLQEFSKQIGNSVPTLSEVAITLDSIRELSAALNSDLANEAHPKQLEYAWGELSSFCAAIARTRGLNCSESTGQTIKQVLLQASKSQWPLADPETDLQFDDFQTWSTPAPRLESAKGLALLSSNNDCCSEDVMEALKALARDPVPCVRYQIVARLHGLYHTQGELMWSLVRDTSVTEESRGVLHAFLSGPLRSLAPSHPTESAELAVQILSRLTDDNSKGASKVRHSCISLLMGLYLWRDSLIGQEVVQQAVSDPVSHYEDLTHILPALRDPLTYGSLEGKPEKDAVRAKAVQILAGMLHNSHLTFDSLVAKNSKQPMSLWSADDQASGTKLLRLLDHIGSEVYFASGAYDEKRANNTGNSYEEPSVRERRQFYIELKAIIEELSDVGIPSLAYHILQVLEYLLDTEPAAIFLTIGRLVKAGRSAGFQYESMAAELIVKLVERFLAEYRGLLRDDGQCRIVLMDVLDLFVEAGWPAARRLTYRLEEIYR